MADEDCRQDLVVQMLLEVLARRAPHDVVAEAEGHGALVFPWLDDLGRLLLFLILFPSQKKCKT